jgi:hypothetical protein
VLLQLMLCLRCAGLAGTALLTAGPLQKRTPPQPSFQQKYVQQQARCGLHGHTIKRMGYINGTTPTHAGR